MANSLVSRARRVLEEQRAEQQHYPLEQQELDSLVAWGKLISARAQELLDQGVRRWSLDARSALIRHHDGRIERLPPRPQRSTR
jgi:hypothetical protein